MKYIRTKEGIFACLDIDTLKVGDLVGINEPILAKSDTIEELCDQFVFVDEFYLHKHRVCHSFENAIALSKKHDVDIKTFRGAIWTDKGLIYVAKWNNEREELELL